MRRLLPVLVVAILGVSCGGEGTAQRERRVWLDRCDDSFDENTTARLDCYREAPGE